MQSAEVRCIMVNITFNDGSYLYSKGVQSIYINRDSNELVITFSSGAIEPVLLDTVKYLYIGGIHE